jgi:hypothetical protein
MRRKKPEKAPKVQVTKSAISNIEKAKGIASGFFLVLN